MGTRRLAVRGSVLAVLLLLLAGCTAAQVEESVVGSFKGWCRQADNCTVHEEHP